jgi:hypothetical protein
MWCVAVDRVYGARAFWRTAAEPAQDAAGYMAVLLPFVLIVDFGSQLQTGRPSGSRLGDRLRLLHFCSDDRGLGAPVRIRRGPAGSIEYNPFWKVGWEDDRGFLTIAALAYSIIEQQKSASASQQRPTQPPGGLGCAIRRPRDRFWRLK